MKVSFEGLTLILLGIAGVLIISVFESVTINNESSYYVLKEAMKASMIESIDKQYYATHRLCSDDKNEGGQPLCPSNSDGTICSGGIKISEQKFVENFTRRFAASINGDVNKYTLEFYDIIESPPKATVMIKSNTTTYTNKDNQTMVQSSADIENTLTGILEYYGS